MLLLLAGTGSVDGGCQLIGVGWHPPTEKDGSMSGMDVIDRVLPTITKKARPSETGFPRLTKGSGSGAIFLMMSSTEGYAISDGADCFMEPGTRVASMSGMLEHDNPELLEHAIKNILKA